MATLRIDITASVAALNSYADDLGYNPVISTIDSNGQPISEPNPQTKANFLKEKVKGIVSLALSQKTAAVIKQTKEDEARTEIVTNRTQIENAMTVTIS
jgi:hypothetical protein